MDLSISIVNWNTRDLLDQCLKSVYETTVEIEFEVIVVDNASSDGSQEMVKTKYPRARLIVNSQNEGFARANNQAYQESSGEDLLLLNPDTILLDGAVAAMLEVLKRESKCAVVAPKLLWPDGVSQPSISHFPRLTAESVMLCCSPSSWANTTPVSTNRMTSQLRLLIALAALAWQSSAAPLPTIRCCLMNATSSSRKKLTCASLCWPPAGTPVTSLVHK